MSELITEGLFIKQDGQIWDLNDLPEGFVIKGDLDLSDKKLEELPDLSKVTVEGNFNCSANHLTSLEGAPKEVGGDFYCSYNQLTSLKGAPEKVGGDFGCDEDIAEKYGLGETFTLDELKASERYIKENKQEMIDKKAQELKYKVLRIFAKENVSSEKVNLKRPDADKAVIKAVMEKMTENIGK